ncbi:MAG: DUF4419 domain-containing protein [Polyangiaceae bacterium]|nr:DUF4419 domain-containing protein [Polyangiaceae bacterium]
MVTIAVSDVARGKLRPPLDVKASVTSLLRKPVEAMAVGARRLVVCDTMHPFVKAAHDAFYEHHSLVIRPDDVWFCIAQGFAAHVRENTEELRSRFVRHEGKQKLTVERSDFFLGRDNPWPEVFAAFSEQVGEHVGKLKDLVSARFSTTTPMEAAAFDVCVMDTFQGYFDYEMRAGCGIPEITLLGTAEDWASMIPRVKHLSEYGLETWSAALVPVLEQIAATAAGNVDQSFWRSFFRYQSGSGPAEMTGWIQTFFPYLIVDWRSRRLGPNPYLSKWREGLEKVERRDGGFLPWNDLQGPSMGDIPDGQVSAPVRYIDLSTGKEHALRFVAGMFGVEQNADSGALSAAFGWAVVYDAASAA